MSSELRERISSQRTAVPEARDSPPVSAGNTGLLNRLNCPLCRTDDDLIVESSPVLRCPSCDTRYPLITCGDSWVPWLFRRPDVSQLEWSARYKGFLNLNAIEHNRLNRALHKSPSSDAARQRIEYAMHARREHQSQVEAVLAPLGLDGDVLVPAVTKTLHDKLPKNQSLTSYAANIFRDWAWDNGENEALLGAIADVLEADQRDDVGSVLTLGAGACRLSYDIHRRYSPSMSVALDFNPLLLLIATVRIAPSRACRS